MKFTALRPMLWLDQFAEKIKFYVNVLGFTCGKRNKEWGWASLFKDNIEIMVAQ